MAMTMMTMQAYPAALDRMCLGAQSFVKVGARTPVPYEWSQRHFRGTVSRQKVL